MAEISCYLAVHDGKAAIAFYTEAFGATETLRYTDDEGRIGHAEVDIDGARLMLSEEYPDLGAHSPRSLGGATSAVVLAVPDVDATYQRAVAAGAAADRPPVDNPIGRSGWLVDPFGHRWNLVSPAEGVTTDELKEQAAGKFTVTAPDGPES